MATSRRSDTSSAFADHALALAAGAWSELGVSGWTSSHADWAIDPEPLILFTAWLGDADPRLRDESTDWCIQNWRFISKARLKNLLGSQPDDVQEAFGEFAATVGVHAGARWPGSTEPRRFVTTGRSTLPPLERPSLVWLRLRAMFGLGARTEILRSFLTSPLPMTVAELAERTSYTKRNITDECDTLNRAGLLKLLRVGNRFRYKLAQRSRLVTFVGELPGVRPNWTALLNVVRELVVLERLVGTSSAATIPVHAANTLASIEADLEELGIEGPTRDLRGADLWPALQALGSHCLSSWAIGTWPEEQIEVAG